jgi:hypothetical protein
MPVQYEYIHYTQKEESNILCIDSDATLSEFTNKYGYYQPDIARKDDNYTLQMSIQMEKIELLGEEYLNDL